MSKVPLNINGVVVKVEEAYEELRQAATVVLKDYHKVGEGGNHYRGKYCFPFFTQGSYYVEQETDSYYDDDGNFHSSAYCFMPMPLDDDMRKFVEALRKLDRSVRPLFSWDIRKDYPREDEGNVLIDECDGFCYIGHTYRKIDGGSNREFGVLVGVIAYNVYKDAFLDEILETVKKNGKPITKAQFRSIQGFSR
jgi:hypothetical protein